MLVLAAVLIGVLGYLAPGAAAQPESDQLPDLEIYSLALGDAGKVVYQVANRGKAGTERPFMVDVYVDGVRKDSITHGPLPGLSVQTAQSNLARLTDCKPGTVRLVLDPQKGLREANRANNERVAQLTPACRRPSR